MDQVYEMLFAETRRALGELNAGNVVEARYTLEGVVLLEQFVRHFRRHDPSALRVASVLRHLEWEWTPEGRLQWERMWSPEARRQWQRERIEWERAIDRKEGA